MKPDKLRNLLTELEARIVRLERSFARADHIALPLASVKAEVRRHLSKIDALRAADVASLEKQITDIPIPDDDRSLANLLLGLKFGLNQLGPDELLESLPGQKTAAFQFRFDGDVLKVVDQPLHPSSREKDIAMAALEGAVEHGEYVIGDLAATNASPRLKEAFRQLQTTMAGYKNIVQVGARAQICNRLVHGDVDELSPTMFSLLIGHIESVFSALAQFEDWRIYSENAANLNVDAGSVEKLTQATAELVKKLRDDHLADRSVVDALDTASRWIRDGDLPDKRDVLSLTRSLENVWSVVSKVVLGLSRDIVSDGRKRIASAILGALLLTAPVIVPIVGKIPGGEWVETVYTYFKAVGNKPPGIE
ncbi:hypothetical protein J2W92_005161 [Rhizobium leguminosarum]|uniref:hypothetical protein n=1 Tax=Rhizobium leguminosarum TaxID=384 RepID=UPI0024B39C5B|nr:hypothetical protein [Rhizobium leguminosarum]WHO79679.1 hypothetical protein QMO81_002371 [Rhizobium leguminosarum]